MYLSLFKIEKLCNKLLTKRISFLQRPFMYLICFLQLLKVLVGCLLPFTALVLIRVDDLGQCPVGFLHFFE